MKTDGPSNARRSPDRLENAVPQEHLDELIELVIDLDTVTDVLPQEEREDYSEAQQSVVDARESAETHEGLLQLH
jgi:hypothetical protein